MSFSSVLLALKAELEADIADVSTDVKESRIRLLSHVNTALGSISGGLSSAQTTEALLTALQIDPTGPHITGSLSASSTETLVKPLSARLLLFSIEEGTADLRLTLDGTQPTALVGFRCYAGERFSIKIEDSTQIKVYSLGPGVSTYQAQWGL